MMRRLTMFSVVVAVALSMVGGVIGQERGHSVVQDQFHYKIAAEGNGPQIDFHFSGPDGFFTMMVDDKLVKGAAYSAQAVNESVQVLADGNRIVRRTVSTIYRDSDGRTRREESGKPGDDQVRTIFINDPVAGTQYILDTGKKIAFSKL